MLKEYLHLLPSQALRERLQKQNHIFSEKDTLLLLYRYARTEDERLMLLSAFAETATEAYAALARRIRSWEEEKLACFRASAAGYVYEMCITDTEADYEDRCLCDTYETALASIAAYFTTYAETAVTCTAPYRFELRKHPVVTCGTPWPKDIPAICRVDADGRVLLVEDDSAHDDYLTEELCAACDNFCLYDDILYPFFVPSGAYVRYTSDHYPHAKVEYGLCPEDFDRTAGSHIYVYPLSSDAVRLCDVSDEACTCAHEHIDAPLCDVITPDELPLELRAPAAAFWEAYRARID